MKIEARRLP